jgi:hypothetical protein
MPNSGNGKAGTLRERLARNEAEMERAIRELEGAEWEEITENHWHLPERARLSVDTDATGRVKVVSIPDAEEITKADHPRPETVPPRGKFVLAVLNTIQPPWLRVPVVLALIGAVVVLILKGVKVWP